MDLIRKEELLSYFVKEGMFPENEANRCAIGSVMIKLLNY